MLLDPLHNDITKVSAKFYVCGVIYLGTVKFGFGIRPRNKLKEKTIGRIPNLSLHSTLVNDPTSINLGRNVHYIIMQRFFANIHGHIFIALDFCQYTH